MLPWQLACLKCHPLTSHPTLSQPRIPSSRVHPPWPYGLKKGRIFVYDLLTPSSEKTYCTQIIHFLLPPTVRLMQTQNYHQTLHTDAQAGSSVAVILPDGDTQVDARLASISSIIQIAPGRWLHLPGAIWMMLDCTRSDTDGRWQPAAATLVTGYEESAAVTAQRITAAH